MTPIVKEVLSDPLSMLFSTSFCLSLMKVNASVAFQLAADYNGLLFDDSNRSMSHFHNLNVGTYQVVKKLFSVLYHFRCARNIQAIFSCFSISPVIKSLVPAS